jgi:hypothetical protein
MSSDWIGVASRGHVRIGLAGGFVQLGHGSKAAVQRLKAGDRIAMYSPRASHPDGPPLQAFTAIGVVRSGQVYQVEMTPDFHPHRVDVDFLAACDAPIRPLISALAFIRDKARWGAAFRFGYVKVPSPDFRVIAAAMNAVLPS